MRNALYYGDNLHVLREYIATASVDLICLDPPFNSSRNYNVLFKEEGGRLLRPSCKSGDLMSGAGMSERALTERVRVLGAAVGLVALSAHDCRHYWATRAATAGTDAFPVCRGGGHC
jgi:hypothetical protein